jgi:DegV family protein with EDD domain
MAASRITNTFFRPNDLRMSRVHIVTDSTVQFCTPGFAEQHAFTLVPLTVRLGQQTYLEGAELATSQIFAQVEAGTPFPVVAAPTVEQFAAAYAAASRQTDQILSIHVSGKLSATARHALAASDTVKGRCSLEVIDSESISAGLGALVEMAVLAAERGAPLEEVVRLVRSAVPRLYAVFVVESLTYLAQAGHASLAQAMLAGMLNIKPFLTLEEGELAPMEKTRNRLQAVEKVVEFVTEFTDIEYLAILQGENTPSADALQVRERLEAAYPGRAWSVLTYGPSLAALLGPHALGVMVCEEQVEPE